MIGDPLSPYLKMIRIALYLVVAAAIFGGGVATGIHLMKPKVEAARADGHEAGVTETKSYYAGQLEQQSRQAAADLKEATDHNNQLKDDYAKLRATWKVDHDAAVATEAALSKRLSSAGADNQRLRNNFAAAVTASRDRCESATGAGQADPGHGSSVPTAAGGLLSADVVGVSGQPADPFAFIADLVKRADAVVDVANDCKAASEVK